MEASGNDDTEIRDAPISEWTCHPELARSGRERDRTIRNISSGADETMQVLASWGCPDHDMGCAF